MPASSSEADLARLAVLHFLPCLCFLRLPSAGADASSQRALALLRRFLVLLGLGWLSCCGPARAEGILILTTSPAPPGRYVALEAAAQAVGVPLQARYVEKIAAADLTPALVQGRELVLLDFPREHLEEFARQKLAAVLPALEHVPHAWLPSRAVRAGGGLDPEFATRLHGYFVQGGARNRDAFVQALRLWRTQGDWRALAAPQRYPSAGIYHPRLPEFVVGDIASYLQARGYSVERHPPLIGIAFHQGSIASEQLEPLDDLVARIEAGGALALPFYSPVMSPNGMQKIVSHQGRVLIDALINTQITLNPEGRRKELAAIGVPVIQDMAWRHGSEADWRADPHGLPITDIPFYLSQAEYAGITDIQLGMATRASDQQLSPIAAQAAAIATKALKLSRLRQLPPAQKKLAIYYWNYPAGEKNLSASYLNVPKSLQNTLSALQGAGYTTHSLDEAELIARLQRLLKPSYVPPQDQATLRALLRDELAAKLPLSRYQAWLSQQPAEVRAQLNAQWGPPERSSMLLRDAGAEPYFVIPRLQLGQVLLLPQPPRAERGGDREKELYHSTSAIPSHYYLANYLWVREAFAADALIHFGTHGTQEWLPGKERGLSVHDWPMLAVGDTPVFYPYIVDNIGEATQAKRRGRATIISHQTPILAPAGLHDRLTAIHDLLHQWIAQDLGGVKDALRADFLAKVREERIDRDLGWSPARIDAEFPAFITAVHDHLHELALTVQPLGLHTLGQGAKEEWRLAQVLMMLGRDFWADMPHEASAKDEGDELLVADYRQLGNTRPFQQLQAYLLHGQEPAGLTPAQRTKLQQAQTWWQALGGQSEIDGLLTALDGRYLPTSYGGDPLKNPDALPTGRNLYAFDPSRVPTRAAWEAGKKALDQLVAAHRAKTGALPKKLSFTLWSVETMRHFGLLEAQALWALGVEPVWDEGGRVTGVKLIPREQLARPRIDVVLSATGLYRDHFPNTMKQLAEAARLAGATSDEADNPVAANTRRITQKLLAAGVPEAAARNAGATRIYSSASGSYGSGLDDAALATDTWKTQAEGDRKLAQLYLARMQYAYGPDEASWGQAGVEKAPGLNLYAEQLRGTEAAVLARSSNLYGMLTTDDPFQYLGGMGLAVRHLDGKAPELYISNLRSANQTRVEGAAEFLSKELATRNFHPGHIQGLMAEGYAGTLQVLDGINNFAGWQSVAREIVRDDQWQEFMDVYVRDKHRLGVKDWFEKNNPHALAQSIERMLEAARLGQWQADPKSVAELKERWRELAARYQVSSDNTAFKAFVAPGFGLAALAPQARAAKVASAAKAAPAAAPPPAPQPPITGLRLDRQPPPQAAPPAALVAQTLASLLAGVAVLAALLGGARRGWHSGNQPSAPTRAAGAANAHAAPAATVPSHSSLPSFAPQAAATA